MLPKVSYFVLSGLSLALFLFEAPRGRLLTPTPQTGKVQVDPNQPHARGGFVFIGGFHGGK